MKVILKMINSKEKEIYYFNVAPWKGDRYEVDWKNDKKEGKGIYYYNDGDREMGNSYDNKPKGQFVMLTKNGEVKIINY